MNKRCNLSLRLMPLLAAAALAAGPELATAQASAPLPELPAASRALSPAARASAAAGPRVRTPIEAARNSTAPGDLRPERPVAPQLKIPFGKIPPAPPQRAGAATPAPAGPGGIDDAAARCESQSDAKARADCRAGLNRDGAPKAPAR